MFALGFRKMQLQNVRASGPVFARLTKLLYEYLHDLCVNANTASKYESWKVLETGKSHFNVII